MNVDHLHRLYTTNPTPAVGLAALAAVGLLLLVARRFKAMKEHRGTLLVANILTVIAAALSTMVSASGMWQFFTDILGPKPIRIAFFAFIEIALLASALLARSRLLRQPNTATTGIDGVAVWALATLTAVLSALDSHTFREVCLRLTAPMVAAWMWERALAAERHVRHGHTTRSISWTINPQRILIWLHLAEPNNRTASDIDRARRRAKLARARLQLHLLHHNNASAWRLRRTHRKVITLAMHAAEHIGLADFPQATTERDAIQMYMATLYGFIDATTPHALTHLHAWTQPAPPPGHTQPGAATGNATSPDATPSPHTGHPPTHDPASADKAAATRQTTLDGLPTTQAQTLPATVTASSAESSQASEPGRDTPAETSTVDRQVAQAVSMLPPESRRRSPGASLLSQVDPPSVTSMTGTSPDSVGANSTDSEYQRKSPTDTAAVEIMRRFWEQELAAGRTPTGADLARAAGVPPSTGLGRRKRRQWSVDLSNARTLSPAP